MIGTLANVAAVLVGGGIGLAAGAKLPERTRTAITAVLGLATMVLGAKMAVETERFAPMVGGLLVGTLIGDRLGIERALHALGEKVKGAVGGQGRFAEGFATASLLFCVGPMTVVGSIQDGAGSPETLYAKALLDGFASIALAGTLGAGVLASAGTVLVVQGTLALAGSGAEALAGADALREFSAAGGVLLLGIGLNLLGVARLRVADMLPGLALAPLFAAWAGK